MTRSAKSLVMGCYAAAVVGNGLLSVLAKEAGKAGLWFGLVMGAMAFVAGFLLWINQRILGALLAWVAVGFVGGWFFYDIFFKKGFGQGEVRMYVVLVLSLAVAVVLCLPAKRGPKPGDGGQV